MTHPSEEDLILHYYGEGGDPGAISAHLATCESCREEHDALRRVLEAVGQAPVPERDPAYGAEVWARLRGRLPLQGAPKPATRFVFPRFVTVGAMAAALVVAFLLGRHWPPPETKSAALPIPAQARERIFLVALGDHLERSQMILVELQNATGDGSFDISAEQQRAEGLLDSNRLYRQTAVRVGDTGLANVLEELERALLEIAHSPSRVPGPEFEALRQRLEAQGILFKVRVIGAQVGERGKPAAAPRSPGTLS